MLCEYDITQIPFKPKFEEEYYSIGVDGSVEDGVWLSDFLDYSLYKLGNCYRTRSEALANRSKWGKFYDSDEVLSIDYAQRTIAANRATVKLKKDELQNIIEFIELNFIDSIRNDTDIDNIDYILSMMRTLQKFRLAYASIKLEEESEEDNQEESK